MLSIVLPRLAGENNARGNGYICDHLLYLCYPWFKSPIYGTN